MTVLSNIEVGIFLAFIVLFVAFLDYGGVRFAIRSETSRLSQTGLNLVFLALNLFRVGIVCSVIYLWFFVDSATWLYRIGAILLLAGGACAAVGGGIMLLDQRRSGTTPSNQ
jgi:hypothetical protein